MNATNVLSHAIAYNNEGILCLNRGKYCDAIHLLTTTLTLVQKAFAQQNSVDGLCKSNSENCISGSKESLRCVFVDLDLSNDWINTAQPDAAASGAQVQTNGLYFVFQKPIYIHNNDIIMNGEESGSDVDFFSLTFALLYNLALVHHLCAYYESNDNMTLPSLEVKRMYRKALYLYGLAYAIHESSEDIHSFMMQTLAILNNVGQIHTVLNNIGQSVETFQQLFNAILYCTTSHNVDINWNEIEGFVNNVMPLLLLESGSSATAAAA